MAEREILAERFEANRSHLRAVAYRMLGARNEAEDAVQEAWLRLARTDASAVENLKGWLTTVVARVCLDMLRARKIRREDPAASAEAVEGAANVERDLQIADSVGLAMLVVLETLSPAARVAFVLHDIFNVPFDDIAPIVGRSPATTRQLASRARQRIQGAPANPDADRTRRREVVNAFLAASQGGDFSALLAILDPDVVLRSDAPAIAASLARIGDAPPLSPEIRGHREVAKVFSGRARAARLALVDGDAGLAIAFGGLTRTVFEFVIEDQRILEISLIADPQTIAALDVEL
ncbi:MAG TPA: sigma-70 family RNA polymerase sigma factor [Hyphomonadaceae bacterium]|nr:sigma-70 family RNA polymerase sigma factor [Hyphomonadaceae bacterium]